MEENVTEPPATQKMTRMESKKEEHKAALKEAQSLNIPNAFSCDSDNGDASHKSNDDDDSNHMEYKKAREDLHSESSQCVKEGTKEDVKEDVKEVTQEDMK